MYSGEREDGREEGSNAQVYRIVIQNPNSSTVIHNVQHDELGFWRDLLEGTVHGEIRIIEESTDEHQAA